MNCRGRMDGMCGDEWDERRRRGCFVLDQIGLADEYVFNKRGGIMDSKSIGSISGGVVLE